MNIEIKANYADGVKAELIDQKIIAARKAAFSGPGENAPHQQHITSEGEMGLNINPG